MSEPVKRYDPFGYDGLSALMHEGELGDWIKFDDYVALAQRCRELEHRIGVSALDRENSTARRDQAERKCDTLRAENVRLAEWYSEAGVREDALRAEVADLKAHLLEAERGNEELVRLRAEKRGLRDLLAETCKAYDEAIHWEDLRQPMKRIKSELEAAHG